MSNNKQTDIAELANREYPFSNGERNAFISGYNKAKEIHKEKHSQTHELKQLRKLAALLQSAWHYGEFKAETVNEREMETIMKEQGYWPVTMSAHTFEPNLKLNQIQHDEYGNPIPPTGGGEITVGRNNNPGNNNTRGKGMVSDLVYNHMIIRETVGYDFLNKVPLEDIPEVMKFLRLIFNYTKMKNINEQQ